MSVLDTLLQNNREWAASVSEEDPKFFPNSAERPQRPHTLWIGCSDSRAPVDRITRTQPGDIFVHRNIANQFRLDDINALSVLRYAVNHLGVEHVIIVGHTYCGGAEACLNAALAGRDTNHTIDSIPADEDINAWLTPLTTHTTTLGLDPSSAKKNNWLKVVEESVKLQVRNLAESQVIKEAFANGQSKKGKKVQIHGWIYDLADGKLRNLGISQGPGQV